MAAQITDEELQLIIDAARRFPEIEKVILFGSRAMRNSKKASDVDLAVTGKTLQAETALRLRMVLNEELPLAYFFDVVRYETIANAKLKQHIDEHGIVLYSRNASGY
ncbi:MAG: nucleotidyltransferase domain-containing protein [Calditrichaeota bacterium]|nr:MAG: nucleotidyltransferase domain-containing protein [Calditrichota bacterium]